MRHFRKEIVYGKGRGKASTEKGKFNGNSPFDFTQDRLALSCDQGSPPKAFWPAATHGVINVFVSVCGEK